MESVDTIKKAEQLEKGRRGLAEKEGADKDDAIRHRFMLRVMVQVNTSGEESKSGAEPGEEVVKLCRHIRDECPHLKLQGLMTIGAIARSKATKEGQENEDFIKLREVRDEVVKELGLEKLELSMGMSEDFESAIRCGSDEVRVGSTIFGERPPKKDAKVKEDVALDGGGKD